MESVRELVMGVFLVVAMVLVRGLMVQALGWVMGISQNYGLQTVNTSDFLKKSGILEAATIVLLRY
jgi:hypothetical protein